MHYSVLVLIDPPDTSTRTFQSAVEAAVKEELASHEDTHWDWYQIGGRWTGLFDGYDPDHDPKRQDTWPTTWPFRPEDIIPIIDMTDAQIKNIHAVAVDGDWYGGEEFIPWLPIGEQFHKRPFPPLSYLQTNKFIKNKLAVIVDCHN